MAGRIDDLVGMVKSPKHFRYHFQRLIHNVYLRERLAKMRAARLPKRRSTQPSEQVISATKELINDGITFLPNLLDAGQLDEILSYALKAKCHDRTRPENGEFYIDEPHQSCHTAVYSDQVTLNCPHVLDTVNHPFVLQTVSDFLGCKPTLSNISMWWSLPGHAKPELAEYFHRDVDDWLFVKLFIYITDVDENAGPHVFVRGTHRSSKLTRIARYSDQQIEKEFGVKNVLQLTAKSGTTFLENTYGIHKGQLPRTNRRLLLQAQYSLDPISILNYHPQIINDSPSDSLDQYINRLYIK